MGSSRPGADQRRLKQVRAIRQEHYGHDEPTLEEQLAEKDRQIQKLTDEIAELRALLVQRERPEPEDLGPEKPAFDFYRD